MRLVKPKGMTLEDMVEFRKLKRDQSNAADESQKELIDKQIRALLNKAKNNRWQVELKTNFRLERLRN